MKLIDLSGKRFGRLVAISQDGRDKHGKVMWNCRCSCGNTRSISGGHLKSGNTKSCGCLQREVRIKHRQSYTRLYTVWSDMKQRCFNKNLRSYEHYGGRGIKICDEWKSFEQFYKWAMRSGYEPILTIDRKDNNGDYTPENCHFITKSENSKKTRSSMVWFVHDTIFLRVIDAAKFWKVRHSTIVRWCNGLDMHGRFYPPKPSCRSIRRYPDA